VRRTPHPGLCVLPHRGSPAPLSCERGTSPAGPPSLCRPPRTVTTAPAGPDGERGAAPQASPCGYLRAPLAPPLLQLVRGVVPAVSHFASLGDPQGRKGGAERSKRGGGLLRSLTAGKAAPERSLRGEPPRRAPQHQQLAGATAPTASIPALRPPPATSSTNSAASTEQREL